MKRTPLVRKTPLARKAARPKAVHSERTAHLGRMKRTATDMNALEEEHVARIRKMPCLVTGKAPVDVHHLMKAPGKRCRRDHRWVIPLHRSKHNGGPTSLHGLGTEAKFEKEHGLAPGYLVAWAKREWEESERVFRLG
jgi:hypothetical protein